MRTLASALRSLRREAGFAWAVVAILALAIGANVAVFAVVNSLLLRPLALPQSDHLLWMGPAPSKCGLSCETYTVDAYQDFEAENHAFASVAGYFAFSDPDNLRLTGHGEPQPVTGMETTANFFETLGVRALQGRLFRAGEDRNGAAPVALLSYRYWQRQFQGSADIVGTTIDLDDAPVTVVGILPASFDFGSMFWPGNTVDVFEPVNLDGIRDEGNTLSLVGRLRPGTTLAAAQADANAVLPHLYFERRYPASLGNYAHRPMRLEPLQDYMNARLRPALELLWCAVIAILLIACVNLGNLALVRGTAKQPEMALRAALGASRAHMLALPLAEAVLLGLTGGVWGLALGWAAVDFLARSVSVALPRLSDIHLGASGVGWGVVLGLVAGLAIGLVPALQAAGSDLATRLKPASAGSTSTPQHERTRSLLTIAEIALACMLLGAAGLLLRSFLRVLDVDLGYQASQAATLRLEYDTQTDGQQRGAFFQTLLERVQAVPGVQAAGVGDYLPLGRNRAWGSVGVAGRVYRRGELPASFVYMVTPGYFEAMGMHLSGRDFVWGDGPHAQQVIVLNQTAAQYLWPQGGAVGGLATIAGATVRVVGVVDDVHGLGAERAAGWQVYFPLMQEGPNGAQLVIRSQLPANGLTPEVMAALRRINPNQPVAVLTPLQQTVERAESPRRFFLWLVGLFAALGLLLAGVGIYGVIAYSVGRRTREIGIRMALGASAQTVQRAVLGRTLALALAGTGLGVGGVLLAGGELAALLFQVPASDPATLAVVAAAMFVLAALAAYVPSRRAAAINPLIAMRCE